MIKLYLDMDGVLCDFDKTYKALRTGAEDNPKRFRAAVMDYKIFEDLEFMPDTQELLNYVSKLDKDITIEILTSKGTFDVDQGNEASRQKQRWLDNWNIPYKANFVRSKEEKSKFADQYSILVDDSPGCVNPFIAQSGHGILHTSSTSSIQQIHDTIRGIRGLNALKFSYDDMGAY